MLRNMQVLALTEGPVIVLDTLKADEHAHGWTGGPSWMVITGVDGSAVHFNRWPQEWLRPNISSQGEFWADLYGFADVFDTGGEFSPPVALTNQRLLVAFPPVANDSASANKAMAVSESLRDSVCSRECCKNFHTNARGTLRGRTSTGNVTIGNHTESNDFLSLRGCRN